MANWLSIPFIYTRGRLLIWAAAGAMVMLLIGGGVGYGLGTARGEARVATLQSEFDQATLKAMTSAAAAQQRELARADQLAAELARTQTDLQEARIQLTRKVSNVTTVYVPAQASAPVALPPAVFTVGFARLWDAANGLSLPAASEAACRLDGEADSGEALGTGCLADSGITQAELLTNHIDNAARCRAIEATLDKYIAWHKELR